MALHAVGQTQVGLIAASFVLALSFVISGISLIPGGVGPFEGLLTVLMIANGVPVAAGAAAGLLFRGFNDILMAGIGAVFLVLIRRGHLHERRACAARDGGPPARRPPRGLTAGALLSARAPARRAERGQLLVARLLEPVQGHAHLGHSVALADGDRVVVERLEVDGDRQGSADLVLAAVATSDRLGLVVLGAKARAQPGRQRAGDDR